MSNTQFKRNGIRAKGDRVAARIFGVLSILGGIGLITKFEMTSMIGGVIMLYSGLMLFPSTRRAATLGVLGFSKVRTFVTNMLWLTMFAISIGIARPW